MGSVLLRAFNRRRHCLYTADDSRPSVLTGNRLVKIESDAGKLVTRC